MYASRCLWKILFVSLAKNWLSFPVLNSDKSSESFIVLKESQYEYKIIFQTNINIKLYARINVVLPVFWIIFVLQGYQAPKYWYLLMLSSFQNSCLFEDQLPVLSNLKNW